MRGTLSFFCLAVGCLTAQIRINEIQIRPAASSPEASRNHQWVELWNPTADAVSLSGWKLAGRTGPTGPNARDLPPVSIPPDGYLVIHIGPGEGSSEFGETGAAHYTQDPSGTALWDPEMDAVALYAPTGITDYFAWASPGKPFAAGQTSRDAVTAKIWTEGAFLNLNQIQRSSAELARAVLPGESLGRDKDGGDTDFPADFDASGGVSSNVATPGFRNHAPYLFDDEPVRFTEAEDFGKGATQMQANRADGEPKRRPWTVMLYMACDDPTIQDVCLEYLRRLYVAGGTTDNAAFVALYDGFDNLKSRRTGNDITLLGMVPPASATLPTYPSRTSPIGERPAYLLNPNGETGGVVIEEQNTGHPNTLGGFIAWAKKFAPADQYALILVGHGRGWKSFGPDLSSPGRFAPQDALYMNELRAATGVGKVDVLAFNSCLMGELEVAHQFLGGADVFVASAEIMGFGGFDYETIHAEVSRPVEGLPSGITPWGLASFMTLSYRANQARWGSSEKTTLMALKMEEVPALSKAVDAFASSMRGGVDFLANKNDPADNAQTGMAQALAAATAYSDTNFIDLHHYASLVRLNGKIPECAKRGVAELLAALDRAILIDTHTVDLAPARGLSIYYPAFRMKNLAPGSFTADNFPYDLVDSRELSGDTRIVVYARNHDALPLQARTMEPPQMPLNPRTEWPAPPAPNLLFVQEHPGWPRFLERYHHPVADAAILYGEPPGGGARIEPYFAADAGFSCEKSIHAISVPVGYNVTLSGAGSTDWDMIRGLGDGNPYLHVWDTDSETGCLANCVAPAGVSPGADAALAANDNMDQDRDPGNTKLDDKDQTGVTIVVPCRAPGQFMVTLYPWDDNHLFPFHDTQPTAAYVHPQTDGNHAYIVCTPPAGTFGTSALPPFIETGNRVRVEGVVVTPMNFGVGRAAINLASTTNVRNATIVRPDPYTSTARTPAGTGNQASTQVQRESAPVPVPDGGGIQFTASGRGNFIVDFIAGNVGTGSMLFDVIGLGRRTVQFPIVARLAPEGDEIVYFPPGNATVGVNVTLAVDIRRNGQPLADAVVTFQSPDNNAVFTSGSLFRSNRGAQVRTNSSGRASVTVQAQVNGEIPIEIFSGRMLREVTIVGRGGPGTAVSRITALELPEFARVGNRSRVVFGVFAGNERMPNQMVRIALVRGEIAVPGSPAAALEFDMRTNQFGEAVLPFTVSGTSVLELTATVTGTQLSTRVFTFLGP